MTAVVNRMKSEGRCGCSRATILAGGLTLAILLTPRLAFADAIENTTAVFAALDKVTARIKPLEIDIGDTQQFGALKVTPRVCYTRPPTDTPLTTAFVEVDEIKLDGSSNRIFTGWMYAQSPGLHAVEHPVFDIWLTNCKTDSGPALVESEKKSPEPASASSRRP